MQMSCKSKKNLDFFGTFGKTKMAKKHQKSINRAACAGMSHGIGDVDHLSLLQLIIKYDFV